MKKLLVALAVVIAFAVGVTGVATLLNGLFNWRLSIEGTQAPADARAGVVLICLGLSIALVCLALVWTPLSARLRRHKLLVLPYAALILSFAVLPIRLMLKSEVAFADAQSALSRGDLRFFKKNGKRRLLSPLSGSGYFLRAFAKGGLILRGLSRPRLKISAATPNRQMHFSLLIPQMPKFCNC